MKGAARRTVNSSCVKNPSLPPATVMADADESLDHWRKVFSSTKSDIFELIDKAILVAAADFPNEFNQRKDQIVRKLHTSVPLSPPSESHQPKLQNLINGDTHPNDETQIVGEVMRIKKVLSNSQNESDSSLHESLKSLQHMPLPVDTLVSTEIGRTVNDLRKHSSTEIQKLVRTLIDGWKASVDDSGPSTTASVNYSLPEKSSATHDSNSALNRSKQREEVPCYASKMEVAKRKLHDGYQRVENEKKRRMIQVIRPLDIPMDSHEEGRPKKKLKGN